MARGGNQIAANANPLFGTRNQTRITTASTESIQEELLFIKNGGKIVEHNGTKTWTVDNIPHREGGPAIQNENGDQEWFIKGQHHREDGPALRKGKRKEWLVHGKLHREDGPSIIEEDGTKHWFINDKRHREDGPAIEYKYGGKIWYENGKKIRQQGIKAQPKAKTKSKPKNINKELYDSISKIMDVHIQEMDKRSSYGYTKPIAKPKSSSKSKAMKTAELEYIQNVLEHYMDRKDYG